MSIKFNKPTVVIMRGASGSGKSTFAKSQISFDNYCSADQFFIDEATGKYNYQRDKVQEAHRQCWKDFQGAMEYGPQCIVIDNTHTRKWECKRYIEEAESNGYDVVIFRMAPTCDFITSNTHGVPPDVVQGMIDRMEPIDQEIVVRHCFNGEYQY